MQSAWVGGNCHQRETNLSLEDGQLLPSASIPLNVGGMRSVFLLCPLAAIFLGEGERVWADICSKRGRFGQRSLAKTKRLAHANMNI